MDLTPHQATLRHLTRTGPDPRVRRRANGLLLVAGGMSATNAAPSRASAAPAIACAPGASGSSQKAGTAWPTAAGGLSAHARRRPVSGPAAGKDERRAGFGALDDASGQVVWRLPEHKDGAGFAQFLDRIAQTWPGLGMIWWW